MAEGKGAGNTAFEDASARRVLERLLLRKRVDPVVRLESGVRYPDLDDVDGWKEVMGELVKEGLVEAKVKDRVVGCPACSSIHVSTRYKCPHCGGFNVVKARILQHVVCGYTDTEVHYERKEGKLVCPRCGRALERAGADFIVLGRIFECEECGRRSSQPGVEHVCRECGTVFGLWDALYVPVYSYLATPKLVEVLFSPETVARRVERVLAAAGVEPVLNHTVVGESRERHHFDIFVEARGRRVAVVMLPSDPREAASRALTLPIAKVDANLDRLIAVGFNLPADLKRSLTMQGVEVLDLAEVGLGGFTTFFEKLAGELSGAF